MAQAAVEQRCPCLVVGFVHSQRPMGASVRVRIHRGAHEIGGSCVEVENDLGKRLVIDIGAPLVTVEGEEPAVPPVEGLVVPDPALQGVVITHAHQDHWGLVDQTLPAVPLFMGEATHRILKEAAFWSAA